MISTYQRLKRQRDAGEIEGGFTLIELLIVIVVLGILAAVVIFSLGGVTGKSTIAACQADGATISTALAAYMAANPTATTANVVQASLTGTGNGGPYLQSWPAVILGTDGYQFQIFKGVLQVETQKVSTDGTSVTVAKTFTNYGGPSFCTGA